MADEVRPETPLDYSDVTTAYANWYQVLGTPEEFDRLIKSETERYALIAKRAGLKKE